MGKQKEITMFGGKEGWKASDWTASDDRVRGGSSQSYLEITGSSAIFKGTLDTKTLGGAGFASQRTTTEKQTWDLSKYHGIQLSVGKADCKKYTFILKDKLLPKDPDTGREQSTISYEYDFEVGKEAAGETHCFFVPWSKFTPTYRGKEEKDAPPLDTENVKRVSIMCRSFFDEQSGDFSLVLNSVKAVAFDHDLEKGFVDEQPRAPKWLLAWSAVSLFLMGYVWWSCCVASS